VREDGFIEGRTKNSCCMGCHSRKNVIKKGQLRNEGQDGVETPCGVKGRQDHTAEGVTQRGRDEKGIKHKPVEMNAKGRGTKQERSTAGQG